jgi:hypothetical protein
MDTQKTGPKLLRQRPGTGEKRKTRQPLKLDRLPREVHEEILAARAEGKTWSEIEDLSREFVPWSELAPALALQYPGRKLPRTTLQRWYDLRVEQVRKEVMAESEQARVFAEKFASAGFEHADDAVVNAFRDEVFRLTQSADPKSRADFQKMLNQLSLVMTRVERVKLQRRRVDADIAKIDAERAKVAAEAGDPREIYLLATQDILKKLRTRQQVREVIDPIREELIQELSYGAESFAKQVETSTAR